jgi:enoyl-CoA hydratase/carnithine racemase
MSLVLYEKREKVAYVTLHHPEKMNTLSQDLVDELVKIWLDFREDNDMWVAIISGDGKAFCAGANVDKPPSLTQSISLENLDLPSGFLTSLALRATPRRYKIWKPIIAALHGYVLGGGVWLALGCDIRIAAEDTKLGLPEPKWNIMTIFAAPLLNYTFPGLALEMLIVGDPIDAERAYVGGLVNKVVTREELIPTATAMAERICENGPLACRAMKQLVWEARQMSYDGQMALSAQFFHNILSTEDTAEGQAAWAERRRPSYKCK